ncbi:MAG: NlpC/P60 family protein [Acidobacteriota bacterium]
MRKTTWISIMVLGILIFSATIASANEVYIVQKGDSIWKIARQNGVSVKKLLQINNLKDENSLQIGDKIIIPDDNNKRSEQPKASEKPKKLESITPEPQQTNAVVYNANQPQTNGAPIGNTPPTLAPPPVDSSRGLDINSNLIKSIVSTAVKHIGVPYHSGGTTPRGFDCSGFVRYVFSKCGIDLPHHSGTMATMGTHLEKSELKTGDLVFFKTWGSGHINHVGIYIGGNRFIHASCNKGITITSLSDGTYSKCYAGARRIIN